MLDATSIPVTVAKIPFPTRLGDPILVLEIASILHTNISQQFQMFIMAGSWDVGFLPQ